MNPNKHFRFLQLPREIRDLIYEFALVRGTISIHCAVTKAPKSRLAVGGEVGFCEALYQDYRLLHPLTYRGTWSVPLDGFAVPETDFQLDSNKVHMTYQLDSSMSRGERVHLHILQACRQIYSEAIEILYGKNIFSFSEDFCIPTAVAFLRDRPAANLSLITSLQLHLIEDLNTMGAPAAHYPVIRESTETLVLQCSYQHFPDLCALLSSPEMRVQRLFLSVETFAQRFGTTPNTVSRALSWEDQNTSGRRPWTASWIEPLLEIKGLDFISIHWDFDRPYVQRMADTVALMCRYMLKTRQGCGKSTVPMDEDGFEIIFRSAPTNGRETGSVITCEPGGDIFSWRDCIIRDDGTGLREVAQDNVQRKSSLSVERPKIRKAEGAYHSVTTCYCELSGL